MCPVMNIMGSIHEFKHVNSTFETKPNVSGIQIYGCASFLHVPTENRKALEDLYEEYILVGYGSGKFYTYLDKKTRKLITVRDIKFDEIQLGFRNLRIKAGIFYIYIDDDEKEKKDAQAPTEDVENVLVRNLHTGKQKKCKYY